jgi:YceI-like domain
MTTRQATLLAALVGSICWQQGNSAERPSGSLRRFDASPGSKVTVKGTSNIHEWRAEGGLISGFLEVGPGFLSAPADAPKERKIEARAEVFIPVRNLKAVGKTWEPDNEQITVAMHRMLQAQEHPKILFRLTEPLAAMARTPTAATYCFEATGDFIIAGISNRVSMPLVVTPLAGRKLKISGSTKLKQSDFKVIPKPRPVLDSWDNDTVEIAFEWMVEQKQDHDALHGSRRN